MYVLGEGREMLSEYLDNWDFTLGFFSMIKEEVLNNSHLKWLNANSVLANTRQF